MLDRKDMTAKEIAKSVWEEMKTRHKHEIATMQENHFNDCTRIVSAQLQECEMVIKEIGYLLK
jgi:hypothetical protein